MLLMSFATISTEMATHPLQSFAATSQRLKENCVPSPVKSGFSLGGQSRGSSVKLCAKFVVDKTITKPKVPPKAKPTIPVKSKVSKPSLSVPAKPDHRRRVSQAGNMFSPTALGIRATPALINPRETVAVEVSNSRQYRTAYLLGRFVALRFTPLRIDWKVSPSSRSTFKTSGPLAATLSIAKSGTWAVRGFVDFKAEYRSNGATAWHEVAGNLQLAALPASVVVSNDSLVATLHQKRPYLVFDDCLKIEQSIGCLN